MMPRALNVARRLRHGGIEKPHGFIDVRAVYHQGWNEPDCAEPQESSSSPL